MKLTKNVDPDKCGYSGYGNKFDARLQFSTSGGSWGKNVVIFGVDNCSSNDVYDKKRYLSSW